MPLLEVKNLCKKIDGKTILDDLNFTVEQGEFLLFAGKNGSGKTVSMLHLGGLVRPTSGEIFFKGKSLQKQKNSPKKIGLVFQEANTQIFCQTVLEEVLFGLKQSKAKNPVATAKQILAKMGIAHLQDCSPFRLSGGQLKKVTIAAVLAQNPEILVLDEPFIGLDYPSVQMVLRSLLDLHRQGFTIVLITHDLEKVLLHATRLLVVNDGKIVYDGDKFAALERLESWGIRKPTDPKKASWLL